MAGTKKRQKCVDIAVKAAMFCHHKLGEPDPIIMDTIPDPTHCFQGQTGLLLVGLGTRCRELCLACCFSRYTISSGICREELFIKISVS